MGIDNVRAAQENRQERGQFRRLERIHELVAGRIHLRADDNRKLAFLGRLDDLVEVLQFLVLHARCVVAVRNEVEGRGAGGGGGNFEEFLEALLAFAGPVQPR